MNDTRIFKKVIVRVIPLILGMYLGRQMTQLFQELTGVHGGGHSQFAPIAVLAFFLGMCTIGWSFYKEFKIHMLLSFVLMCCGIAIAAFGFDYLMLAY